MVDDVLVDDIYRFNDENRRENKTHSTPMQLFDFTDDALNTTSSTAIVTKTTTPSLKKKNNNNINKSNTKRRRSLRNRRF